MDFLIKYVKSKQEEHAANNNLLASLLTMWFAFNKYYKLTNKTPAYVAALLLNPTLRRQYLVDYWQALEERDLGTIDQAVKAARKLQQKEYKYKPVKGEETLEIDLDLIKNTYKRWKYIEQLKRASTNNEFKRFIAVSSSFYIVDVTNFQC